MNAHANPPVHSGNYYSVGARRVVAKLTQMGMPVPLDAVKPAEDQGRHNRIPQFSKLDQAVMDWFSGQDYKQATALIHRQEKPRQWYIINIQDFERVPPDLSHGMISPSLQDAVAAVLTACDQSLVRMESARKEEGGIVFVMDGHDTVQIQPITLEPFNLEVRDRVRTAFKGLRLYHDDFYGRLTRLPGYKGIDFGGDRGGSATGGMMLSFPGNWALAMRNALAQAGITVKQSQAQELAAVFFGASDWHQLVRHQDNPDLSLAPVAVETAAGRTFYHTTEEALFAAGKVIEQNDVADKIMPNYRGRRSHNGTAIILSLAPKALIQAMDPMDHAFCPTYIQTGTNDYCQEGDEEDDMALAAQQLLATLAASDKDSPQPAPFDQGIDGSTMLVATLARVGIPESQIVFMGDYALAVSYGDTPGARLQIYLLGEGAPRKIPNGDIAMYKASAKLVKVEGGAAIYIAGDYGRNPPILIPITHWALVQRFADLVEHPSISCQLAAEYGGNVTPIRRKK